MYFVIIANIILICLFSFFPLYRDMIPVGGTGLFIGFFSILAVFNLLIWLSSRRKKAAGKEKYNGLEKRSFFRVVYRPNARPRFKVADEDFAVADISQSGMRFINDRDVELDLTIQGTVTFADGEAVDITGNVEWKKDNEISLLLKDLLPHTTISKERLYLS